MPAKSEFVKVLQGYNRWFHKVAPMVRKKFGVEVRLGELITDRGGEMTTTYGSVESPFDTACGTIFNTRKFGSAGVPQTAAVRMERFWMTMKEAADASMLSAPAIPEAFKMYAYMFAIDH